MPSFVTSVRCKTSMVTSRPWPRIVATMFCKRQKAKCAGAPASQIGHKYGGNGANAGLPAGLSRYFDRTGVAQSGGRVYDTRNVTDHSQQKFRIPARNSA